MTELALERSEHAVQIGRCQVRIDLSDLGTRVSKQLAHLEERDASLDKP